MRWLYPLLGGLAVGAMVAVLMCYIALDHNPQGEFADPETGAFTSDLYVLFGVYTAVVGLPTAALLAAIGLFRRDGD